MRHFLCYNFSFFYLLELAAQTLKFGHDFQGLISACLNVKSLRSHG